MDETIELYLNRLVHSLNIRINLPKPVLESPFLRVWEDSLTQEHICQHLDSTSLIKFWYVIRIDFNCSIYINDQNKLINELSGINFNTILSGSLIEKYGSRKTWKYAVNSSSDQLIRALISSGINPDFCLYKYYYLGNQPRKKGLITGLTTAVYDKNHDLATFILDARADPNHMGPRCILPLHEAISNRDIKMINILINRGANITRSGKNFLTPLTLAIQTNDIKIVDYILSFNPTLNSITLFGQYPLLEAIKVKNPEIVERLLISGAKFRMQEMSEIFRLGSTFNAPTAQLDLITIVMLEHGMTERENHIDVCKHRYNKLPEYNYDYFLETTIRYKLVKSAKWILDQGNKFSQKSLNISTYEAVRIGNLELTQRLLDLKNQ